MTFSASHTTRTNIAYIGAHASLLLSGIGLLFLQQYLWFTNIVRQGYGPFQSTSYLAGASAVIVIADLIVLRRALKGPRYDLYLSMFLPALFFGVAVFILLANNNM